MNTATATREEKVFNSYLEDRFEEAWNKGIKQGMEKGIETTIRIFITKNLTWTDQQVAESFEVSLDFVKKVRSML
jgi:hypothetical protein